MEVKPVTISFKKNIEDKELFDWIISHSNLSGFIKDILRAEKNKTSSPIAKKEVENRTELVDLSDF